MNATDPPKLSKRAFFLPPREVRDMIYGLLLTFEEPIKVSSPGESKDPVHRSTRIPNRSAILRVNKQIYAEASNIFYSENTFIFGNFSGRAIGLENLHGMAHFFNRVPIKHLHCIRTIEIWPHETGRYCVDEGCERRVNETVDDVFHDNDWMNPEILHMLGEIVHHLRGVRKIYVEMLFYRCKRSCYRFELFLPRCELQRMSTLVKILMTMEKLDELVIVPEFTRPDPLLQTLIKLLSKYRPDKVSGWRAENTVKDNHRVTVHDWIPRR